ncbi:hypothetical protein [Dyadobacter arcticus]|uniref:Late embryogenesis abundant protein LEA-2 subgroup domain-containing protein n=1 Tax=Dyadobacter arcticus TaxID=1078754 RepID=A0ABX0UN72_9BACT|nr:hypothetical protein [Dyadobacter arcticus]NIJ54401.1 hypothetical protein [Dyadobacter arcticus]
MVYFFKNHIFTPDFSASLVSGFITSFVFLFILLFLFRPHIKIGPSIALHVDDLDPTLRLCCAFKIVNKSFFGAYDLKVEVCQKLVSFGPNGATNYRTVPLPLLRDHYPHVAPFKVVFSSNASTDFALWFITYSDLKGILTTTPHTKIEIRVTCRHALTGLGNVWTREYTKTDITLGTFKSGNTFEIV